MTRLREIVDALAARNALVSAPATWPPVTGVVDDSRQVDGPVLFCAIDGTAADGHDYVADAVARGAAAALVTRPVDVPVPQVTVRDGRVAAAVAAAVWFGRPGDDLRLVGVTGTNGKSTTVALSRHLLNAAGDVGALGTVGVVDGHGQALSVPGGLTTPGPAALHGTLAGFVACGVQTVVLEVSSHALHQERVAELGFRAAIFTNLTHEHLDYHGDADAYLAAKARLSAQLAEGGVEVVNADDPAWDRLPRRDGVRRITYGLGADRDVGATEVVTGGSGSTFVLHAGGHALPTAIPLLGQFNVSNALAAAAVARELGVELGDVAARLREASQVPGRMEVLVADSYTVVRDYAHTPDAFERVLGALRPLTEGRVTILFGCGGDRDRAKRATMGRIAAAKADMVIVTSDNPRSEDPERILDDVEAGMGEVPHLRIPDREQAIHRGLETLAPGDCLLLAGKGHETYQIIGDERHPFDERTIVRDALGLPAA